MSSCVLSKYSVFYVSRHSNSSRRQIFLEISKIIGKFLTKKKVRKLKIAKIFFLNISTKKTNFQHFERKGLKKNVAKKS